MNTYSIISTFHMKIINFFYYREFHILNRFKYFTILLKVSFAEPTSIRFEIFESFYYALCNTTQYCRIKRRTRINGDAAFSHTLANHAPNSTDGVHLIIKQRMDLSRHEIASSTDGVHLIKQRMDLSRHEIASSTDGVHLIKQRMDLSRHEIASSTDGVHLIKQRMDLSRHEIASSTDGVHLIKQRMDLSRHEIASSTDGVHLIKQRMDLSRHEIASSFKCKKCRLE